ncbi:LPXTG cell wall anchor domain-containing protein, partial [candidate division FCPU426 bacterium]|nr:LPXTG cell wall anchor domain-containing protein [candidate division FCPU426 bacterium]
MKWTGVRIMIGCALIWAISCATPKKTIQEQTAVAPTPVADVMPTPVAGAMPASQALPTPALTKKPVTRTGQTARKKTMPAAVGKKETAADRQKPAGWEGRAAGTRYSEKSVPAEAEKDRGPSPMVEAESRLADEPVKKSEIKRMEEPPGDTQMQEMPISSADDADGGRATGGAGLPLSSETSAVGAEKPAPSAAGQQQDVSTGKQGSGMMLALGLLLLAGVVAFWLWSRQREGSHRIRSKSKPGAAAPADHEAPAAVAAKTAAVDEAPAPRAKPEAAEGAHKPAHRAPAAPAVEQGRLFELPEAPVKGKH